MIPKWLEHWLPLRAWVQDAPYTPEVDVTRDELVFQMLREDIGFLAWVHNNLAVPEGADIELQKIWESKKRLYDRYARLDKAGLKLSPEAKAVREAIDELGIMPKAVNMATGDMGERPPQDFNTVAAWLRDEVQRRKSKLPVAPGPCLRMCKAYLQEHLRQPIW